MDRYIKVNSYEEIFRESYTLLQRLEGYKDNESMITNAIRMRICLLGDDKVVYLGKHTCRHCNFDYMDAVGYKYCPNCGREILEV